MVTVTVNAFSKGKCGPFSLSVTRSHFLVTIYLLFRHIHHFRSEFRWQSCVRTRSDASENFRQSQFGYNVRTRILEIVVERLFFGQ